MTHLDDHAARGFDGLDARGAQEALAEELSASEEGEKEDASSGQEQPRDDEVRDDEARVDEGIPSVDEDQDGVPQKADPVWNAAQEAEHLRMVEALLFAALEPLDEKAMASRLPQGVDIANLLETLTLHYENRGVNLVKLAGKWRFVTSPDVASVLEKEKIEPRKLSRAALETLAIIAYHQPCTRADIEDVRGVQVSKGSLDQLLEIGWVKLRGRRKDAPGRPVLYGTTPEFLEHFALDTVQDLPGMADLKAAGLLDARLPPGFTVPTPTDSSEEEDVEEADEKEFAQDFMASEEEAQMTEE